MNYLIGRVSNDATTQKPAYKCLTYSETSKTSGESSAFRAIGSDQKSRHTRRQQQFSGGEFVDFSSHSDEVPTEPSRIQLSVSQDEFCRNIDNIIDEQFSFTFNKVQDSVHAVLPPKSLRHKFKRQINTSLSSYALITSLKNNQHHRTGHSKAASGGGAFHHCKFPRWLNKKWHNLKQTKLFTIDYKLDSLLVYDQKNAININKFTCSHMRVRKSNYVQAVVKSLNGW